VYRAVGRGGGAGGVRRDNRVGVATAAAALVTLIVVVIIGSWTTDRAAQRSQHAVLVSTAYQSAATAMADEQSLHRKYRLEPGPVPLAGHRAAGREVERALADVRRLGGPSDRALVTDVLAQHATYERAVDDLFAAVDRRDSDARLAVIDNSQVDPVFYQMQRQTSRAASGHQSTATSAVDTMRRTGRVVLLLDAATLLAGMILITVAGVSLTRSQRHLRVQNELNRHQATHDSLTGLPNRALFRLQTARAVQLAERSGEQVAIVLIDLDRFKDVNDTLGHHYGDVLLAQVARRFNETVRVGDGVARLGGDEFAVLLGATDAAGAVVAARRLTAALAEPFTVRGISLDVEASIGIALVEAGSDVETAMRHADVAMYQAKREHLPFATYELTHDDNTLARLALLGDLRRAVTHQELVLHYQPKVSPVTRTLHSVEALVRWNHPTRGLLSPDAFVPVAETTTVIHPMTQEILRMALAQARRWMDRGWTIPVAVNISARCLLVPEFATEVGRQLEAAAVPACLLSLELTESAMMTDPARALGVLRSLDAMGIALSIDDFGTGYSSMSYLKDLPVRELKIDRSFVAGMATDDSDVVLVRSAVDLGHNLGLDVVAEGVEDASTQLALTAMGCDLVQGYHIRRPADPAELDPWLAIHAGGARHPAAPAGMLRLRPPRAASPRAASPRAASPRAASPRAAARREDARPA